eukprot:758426-Hanusia_phi.AAC.4
MSARCAGAAYLAPREGAGVRELGLVSEELDLPVVQLVHLRPRHHLPLPCSSHLLRVELLQGVDLSARVTHAVAGPQGALESPLLPPLLLEQSLPLRNELLPQSDEIVPPQQDMPKVLLPASPTLLLVLHPRLHDLALSPQVAAQNRSMIHRDLVPMAAQHRSHRRFVVQA